MKDNKKKTKVHEIIKIKQLHVRFLYLVHCLISSESVDLIVT